MPALTTWICSPHEPTGPPQGDKPQRGWSRGCRPGRPAPGGPGLLAIVGVGETRAEREAAATIAVVGGQLEGSPPDGAGRESIVIAYEPVWAIGSGLTP